MRLQYALYERAERGYCWTWRSSELSEGLLDDFRYRIELPSDANAIRPDELRGGICKFARIVNSMLQEHVVLYRFFDGGSDAGRPNRVVMLSAWASPSQIASMSMPYAIASVLQNKMFDYVSGHSREVNIAEPAFVSSLTAEEEWAVTGISRMPPIAMAKFIDEALGDADNDYVLTIRDDKQALQKKPSVVFERKQRMSKVSLPPKTSPSSAETAGVGVSKPMFVGDSVERKPVWFPGIAKGVVPAVAVFAVLAAAWLAVKGQGILQGGSTLQGGSATLSPPAEQLVSTFKKLARDEQERVLRELERVYGQRQSQGMTLGPSPYSGGATKHEIPANGLPIQGKSSKK